MVTMACSGDVPELCSDSDTDSMDWNEAENTEAISVRCLFCSQLFENTVDALTHSKDDHGFILSQLKTKFDMDCYSYIKLINFIHKHKLDPSTLMNASEKMWDKEEYLKPVIENDPWLMYDFEETEDISYIDSSITKNMMVRDCNTVAALKSKLQEMTNELEDKKLCILTLIEKIKKMQEVTKTLFDAESPIESVEKCVHSIKVSADEGYFSTYGHFDIHHTMLTDQVRTKSYKEALCTNSENISGKIVLDLGCGTGILSMFAASAGAEKVIGIDQSEIIYHAMDIIRENKLDHKIELVKGRLEDTELPIDKVDIIVSEWMGYFLLFEAMLDSVIYARDHHLSPGGILMPNRCSISLVGVSDLSRHKELVGFWEDVYGFRMTCMQSEVVREANVEVVASDKVATSSCILTQLDLYTCNTGCMDYSVQFSLEALRDCEITALVGYFDVYFDLSTPVHFSTGPLEMPTHWKQTVFLLKCPVSVKSGQTISGKLSCHRKEIRSLMITISLMGNIYKYVIS